MESERINGSVALVTGGARGLGEGIARRLASQGAKVVIADVDVEAGRALAEKLGGLFVRCDVRHFEQNQEAVKAAMDAYGGLHIVALNAGVSSGYEMGENFNLASYQRTRAIDLDGVVYGANAAYPALRANAGGDIVATASIAGLLPVPFEPAYAAAKHGVVGLVRALGPAWEGDGIRVNALCPGFADTAMIDNARDMLAGRGIEVLAVNDVVDGFMTVLTSNSTGQSWPVLPRLPIQPFRFAEIPGLKEIYPEPTSVRQAPPH